MHVKILENIIAKEYIKDNENFKNILEDFYILEWFDEKNVKLYLLFKDDNIVSFSLLSKMDRDPLKKHINPYYLSYIYTFENYRRKKFASKLLEDIKKDLETTVFCTNDNNKDLFEKAGFIFSSFERLYNSFPIYRYP
jgi:hypothetical protein